MENNASVKNAIIERYNAEARERDNDGWYNRGNSVRVPESKASHYFIDRKVETALALCGSKASGDPSVLEIGCSFGHMTSLLAGTFTTLCAVDLSPESIRVAKERLRRYGITHVSFVADDAEELTHIPDATYDIIFSFSTIRFCPDPVKALGAIRRKLKTGGILIVDFPNRYSPWHLFVKSFFGIRRHDHDNLYSYRTIDTLMRSAGFEIADHRRILFTTKRLPDLLLPVSVWTDRIFEHLPILPLFAGIIMVKVRAR